MILNSEDNNLLTSLQKYYGLILVIAICFTGILVVLQQLEMNVLDLHITAIAVLLIGNTILALLSGIIAQYLYRKRMAVIRSEMERSVKIFIYQKAVIMRAKVLASWAIISSVLFYVSGNPALLLEGMVLILIMVYLFPTERKAIASLNLREP